MAGATVHVEIVSSSSPLFPEFVHVEPIVVGGRRFYTIRSMVTAIMLTHHGLEDRIDEIVFDPRFKADSFKADNTARVAIQDAGFPSLLPSWLVNRYVVLFTVLREFALNAVQGNSFREYFDYLYMQHGVNVGFLRSGSRQEYVFSCGIRANHLYDMGASMDTIRQAVGFNTYGRLLSVVFHQLYTGQLAGFAVVPIGHFINQRVIDVNATYTKAVALVSDSIFRHAALAESGDVFAKGGATATTLVERLRDNRIDLTSYKVVVICIGTNDSRRPRHMWGSLWAPLEDLLLESLHLSPDLKIIINTGIGYPTWSRLPDHAQYLIAKVRSSLPATRVTIFDWSVPGPDNHFLTPLGQPVAQYVDIDHCHPNKMGLQRMAIQWATNVAEMGCLKICFFQELYPVGQL